MSGNTSRHQALRWPGVVAVLTGIAFLTWGWSWIATGLDDTEAVRPGTRYTLGDNREARLTVPGRGWELSRSASSPEQTYALSRGELRVTVSFAELETEDADAWAGAVDLARVAGQTLGSVRETTVDGVRARTARLIGGGEWGSLTLIAPRGSQWAVSASVLGPGKTAPTDRAAARELVRSIEVEGAS